MHERILKYVWPTGVLAGFALAVLVLSAALLATHRKLEAARVSVASMQLVVKTASESARLKAEAEAELRINEILRQKDEELAEQARELSTEIAHREAQIRARRKTKADVVKMTDPQLEEWFHAAGL